MRLFPALLLILLAAALPASAAEADLQLAVVDGAIPAPLTQTPGSAAEAGRAAARRIRRKAGKSRMRQPIRRPRKRKPGRDVPGRVSKWWALQGSNL
jgi:hypothetical protein